MEKFKFSNIIKCILFCICIIHSECNADEFTLLDSPEYICEQGGWYVNVTDSSKRINKNDAALVYDPLNPECFHKIFSDENKDNAKNFLNAILYPRDAQNPLRPQIENISKCDYYQNTPGKPIIYKCTLNDKTNFEVVLSVIKDSAIGRMVKYYQRII